jgi:hypothetical protein
VRSTMCMVSKQSHVHYVTTYQPHVVISADPLCTVGGARDYNRATAAAAAARGATQIPIAANLFSELSHHPRSTTKVDAGRFLPQNVPITVDDSSCLPQAARANRPLEELVHGQQRYKYFKRPHVAVGDIVTSTVYVALLSYCEV